MKKFIRVILIYSIVILILHILLLLVINGGADPMYGKFTSSKQKSLIIGTSRAGQGLNPDYINPLLANKYSMPIYNFALSLSHSPYGDIYLKAIKKKLDTTSTNGLFILVVDPWSISAAKSNPNNSELFFEKKLALGKVNNINCNPNLEYLFKCYKHAWGSMLLNMLNNQVYLHKNGWLEVTVDMDKSAYRDRLKDKVSQYSKKVKFRTFSQVRFNYLLKTIEYLNKHGKVVLVRLPVSTEIYKFDNDLMPQFDSLITANSKLHNYLYLNYKKYNNQYRYTDGNHLYKKSSNTISRIIATDILNAK